MHFNAATISPTVASLCCPGQVVVLSVHEFSLKYYALDTGLVYALYGQYWFI